MLCILHMYYILHIYGVYIYNTYGVYMYTYYMHIYTHMPIYVYICAYGIYVYTCYIYTYVRYVDIHRPYICDI